METRTFSASLEQLHEMLYWIRDAAEKMGFGSSDLYKIELAAEEALVNVIHHSYRRQGRWSYYFDQFDCRVHENHHSGLGQAF